MPDLKKKKNSQMSLVGDIIYPKGKSSSSILLNVHAAKLPHKHLCVCL